MIDWIYRKLIGYFLCDHKWIVLRSDNFTRTRDKRSRYGLIHTLQCEKCGNLKTFDTQVK
jgi:hypothetical protein